MRISEGQLDEYIALYKKEFGEELERGRALIQFHKLIRLVLYMVFPEKTVMDIELAIEKGYTNRATLNE